MRSNIIQKKRTGTARALKRERGLREMYICSQPLAALQRKAKKKRKKSESNGSYADRKQDNIVKRRCRHGRTTNRNKRKKCNFATELAGSSLRQSERVRIFLPNWMPIIAQAETRRRDIHVLPNTSIISVNIVHTTSRLGAVERRFYGDEVGIALHESARRCEASSAASPKEKEASQKKR